MCKLIDSHCHLPINRTALETVLGEARKNGVEKLVNIGTNVKTSEKACQIAEEQKNVYATVGIYPHEEKNTDFGTLSEKLGKLIHRKKVVAIGECGIDISEWKGGRSLQDQQNLFELQIKLAITHNLPITMHNRNADKHVLEMLSYYHKEGLRGVSHCFASSWKTAKKLIDLDFFISFSGLITYPSRKELVETVTKVPMDKFVLETDSPYLPPTGHRGEKNQPKYVKITARKMAELRNEKFETICRHSYENTCHIFGLEHF
jgi:TatD DNase family protein